MQHGDPRPHRHRLDLVVGDVDGGHRQIPLQAGDLGTHLHAELGVEVGEGFVHEEGAGVPDDGPSHRHPLALPAGELSGPAVQHRFQLEQARRLLHPLVDLGLAELRQLQGVADVPAHGQVRVQRIALEHHGDVPVLRRGVGHVAPADRDLTLGHLLETRHHAQEGGLAAAGGAHEHEQLAVGDVEVDVVHGHVAVRVALGHAVQGDVSHGGPCLGAAAWQRRRCWLGRHRRCG